MPKEVQIIVEPKLTQYGAMQKVCHSPWEEGVRLKNLTKCDIGEGVKPKNDVKHHFKQQPRTKTDFRPKKIVTFPPGRPGEYFLLTRPSGNI